jgi:hypothetical protein
VVAADVVGAEEDALAVFLLVGALEVALERRKSRELSNQN